MSKWDKFVDFLDVVVLVELFAIVQVLVVVTVKRWLE